MRSSPSPRSFATSTSTPVTYCTWIRRNWPVSGDLDTASTATAPSGVRRRLGERPRRYRRSLSGGVRRSAARRRPTHLHSVPAASRRALRFDGSSGAPSDDRQRAWLRLEALESPMPSTRDPAHLHPALHPHSKPTATSRTLHPHTQGARAYGTCYQTSARRTRALRPWLNHYNRHRSPRRHRHDTADRSALRGEFVNNLPRTHT